MSFFTEILAAPAATTTEPAAGSSLLGATGLSRARLAALFREQGLFGRDSSLSPAEQALVQSRLGHIPGLRPRPATTWMTPRLQALAAYTDARITQQDAQVERRELAATGLSAAAINETARVVENVRTVFGLLYAPQRITAWMEAPALA